MRQKLLILLLVAALLPALAVVLLNRSLVRETVDELEAQARAAVAARLVADMRRVAGLHSAALGARKTLTENTLRLVAYEARTRMLAGTPSGAGVFGMVDRSGTRPYLHLPPTTDPRHATRDAALIAGIGTVLEDVVPPDLLADQGRASISFLDGLHVDWPGDQRLPADFDPRQDEWYLAPLASASLKWSSVLPGESPYGPSIVAAMPFRDAGGTTLGVVAVRQSIDTIMRLPVDRNALPPGLQVLLATVTSGPGAERHLIRIGGDDLGKIDEQVSDKFEVITLGDPATDQRVIAAVGKGGSGIVNGTLRGEPAIWAYSPIEAPSNLESEAEGTIQPNVVLMAAPIKGIDAEAAKAGSVISDLVARQAQWAAGALLIIAALATLAAFMLARQVSQPLQRLAQAARRLGRGDFTARAEVETGDELGDLARGFNRMVPELGQLVAVRRSLALAEDVQKNLLPSAPPTVAGFDLAGRADYCDETGGDYFDFIPLAAQADEPQRFAVVIGDVSGHGIAAALLMTSARALLRGRAHQPTSPHALLDHVNACLADDVVQGRFMTLCVLEVTAGDRRVRFANAGHPPIFCFDPSSNQVRELKGDGPPLGVVTDIKFESQSLALKTGQVLVMATDGLWEAANPAGEAFGRDRLKAAIRDLADQPAAAIVAGLCDRVTHFAAGTPNRDDVTVVVVKAV